MTMTIHAERLEGGLHLPYKLALEGESWSRSSEVQTYLEPGNSLGPRISFEGFGAGEGGRVWLEHRLTDIQPDGQPTTIVWKEEQKSGEMRAAKYTVRYKVTGS